MHITITPPPPHILDLSLISCIELYGRYYECHIINVSVCIRGGGGGAGWVNAMFDMII